MFNDYEGFLPDGATPMRPPEHSPPMENAMRKTSLPPIDEIGDYAGYCPTGKKGPDLREAPRIEEFTQKEVQKKMWSILKERGPEIQFAIKIFRHHLNEMKAVLACPHTKEGLFGEGAIRDTKSGRLKELLKETFTPATSLYYAFTRRGDGIPFHGKNTPPEVVAGHYGVLVEKLEKFVEVWQRPYHRGGVQE